TAGVDRERARPLVVAERRERRLEPARRAGRLVANRRAEQLVPVAENARADVDAFADRPLDRVAAAVDLWGHALNLDARGRVVRLRKWHCVFSFDDTRNRNRGRRPW